MMAKSLRRSAKISSRPIKRTGRRLLKDGDYTPPKCGPPEGVEADGEGGDVKEAVQAATRNAMDVCKLYKGCDTINPTCLFKVSKVKVADLPNNRKKATAIGLCECGTRETLPGEMII